jgi:hypothetical protein
MARPTLLRIPDTCPPSISIPRSAGTTITIPMAPAPATSLRLRATMSLIDDLSAHAI